VRAETVFHAKAKIDISLLLIFAVVSVVWWHLIGDLRLYLLLQGLPLILIPMWQAIYCASASARIMFGGALPLYVMVRVVEFYDHALLAALGAVSGYTLKHLLAAAAAGVVVMRLRYKCKDHHHSEVGLDSEDMRCKKLIV